jgi:hypothetical protein
MRRARALVLRWNEVAARRPALLLLPLCCFVFAATLALPARPDDEAGYLELARNLADGHYATGRPDALLDASPAYPDLWFGPGLPLVLALPVAAGMPLDLLRLTGPVALVLALVVFFRLCRRFITPLGAVASTWALGLYLPLYTVLPNLHSEPLAVLLVVFAMYAIARRLEGDGRVWLVVGAASLAGVAVTRVAYGWVLTVSLGVFVLWWVVSRSPRARSMTATCALALVLCVPWLAYTSIETGRVLQWGNSGALSLYWMSSPYPGDHGDWQQANAVFTDPDLGPHRPFFESLRGLELPEQNAQLERKALEQIREHPLAYLGNLGTNLSRMLFDVPYSHEPERSNALLFALPNAILLGAVAVAAALSTRVRVLLPAPWAPFAIFAATAFGLHLLVATYPRMLIPIAPVLVWLAATTIAAYLRVRHGLTLRPGRADEDAMPHSRDILARARPNGVVATEWGRSA